MRNKRSDASDMKTAVKRGSYYYGSKGKIPESLNKGRDWYSNPQKYLTEKLSYVNNSIRVGEYIGASYQLEDLFERIRDYKGLTRQEKDRYGQAVIRRLDRIIKSPRVDARAKEHAKEIRENLESRRFGVLEGKTILGIVSFIGLSFGFISLFPSITGNVISESVSKSLIFPGFLLILFGLLGISISLFNHK